jgi:ketosteroid isomerase-like protein
VDRAGVEAWVSGYERAWRTPGTAGLADLFAGDVAYLYDPYEEPVRGLAALGPWWEEGRDGPDEVFTMTTDVVAVDGDVAVVRAEVAYGEPVRQEYRDLWVVRFGPDGRCVAFEEWPFWPGHGRSPSTARPSTP